MGRLLLVSLPATGAAIYRCKHCDTHLAYATDIISRMFRCKHGKAYLLGRMANVAVGEKEERMMTTGWHTVRDIFCVACGCNLGWKYIAAAEKTQRYKEGKFILDRREVLATASLLPAATATNNSSGGGGGGGDDDGQNEEEADSD